MHGALQNGFQRTWDYRYAKPTKKAGNQKLD